MIIVVHLVFFAALYLGLPLVGAASGDGSLIYNGGILATIAMALASEATIVAAAVLSSIFTRAIGINPLLQRSSADSISLGACFVFYFALLCAVSAWVPSLITVTWSSALLLSAFVCVVLQVMLKLKRAWIARS
jgi:hypothetical protein